MPCCLPHPAAVYTMLSPCPCWHLQPVMFAQLTISLPSSSARHTGHPAVFSQLTMSATLLHSAACHVWSPCCLLLLTMLVTLLSSLPTLLVTLLSSSAHHVIYHAVFFCSPCHLPCCLLLVTMSFTLLSSLPTLLVTLLSSSQTVMVTCDHCLAYHDCQSSACHDCHLLSSSA